MENTTKQSDLEEFMGWNNETKEEINTESNTELPYFNFIPNEFCELTYIDSEKTKTKYNKEDDEKDYTMKYIFLDPKDNKEKVYFSKSKRLGYGLLKAKVEKGVKLKIKKTGEKQNTNYEVTKA